MRALGVDIGTLRIGVAVCGSTAAVAVPLVRLKRSSGFVFGNTVARMVEEYDADVVVVGLPVSLNGQAGAAASAVHKDVKRMKAALTVPVVLWDERLTTVTAHRALSKTTLSGRERRSVIDQLAATVILQSWIDAGRPCE